MPYKTLTLEIRFMNYCLIFEPIGDKHRRPAAGCLIQKCDVLFHMFQAHETYHIFISPIFCCKLSSIDRIFQKILLDEIGELSPDMQAKHLQVIEEKDFYRLGPLKWKRSMSARPLATPTYNFLIFITIPRLNYFGIHFEIHDCQFDHIKKLTM